MLYPLADTLSRVDIDRHSNHDAVINTDLAELILDDRELHAMLSFEYVVQQCRLPGAQEPGDYRYRHLLRHHEADSDRPLLEPIWLRQWLTLTWENECFAGKNHVSLRYCTCV